MKDLKVGGSPESRCDKVSCDAGVNPPADEPIPTGLLTFQARVLTTSSIFFLEFSKLKHGYVDQRSDIKTQEAH